MENVSKGLIIFNKYIVKKVLFELNESYNQEEVDINLDIKSNIKVLDDNSTMLVEMVLDIFKDAIKRHYPFHMELIIEGTFLINADESDGSIERYQGNAIAILYPYARAIISTYTANTNVTPLILPTINVNKFIQKQ